MYNIMKITDLADLSVYFLAGHDESDAYGAFGEDIEITKLVAVEAFLSDDIEDMINARAEEEL